MQSRMSSKLPLCKFINNCKTWKQTGRCQYAHNKCKEGAQCSYGQKCRFYHPERAGPSNSKPSRQQQSLDNKQRGNSKVSVKNVPCQYGINCKKKQLGQCYFNHSLPPPTFNKTIEEQCKFGAKCNKFALGTCKYKHTQNKPMPLPVQRQQSLSKQMSIQQNNIQQNGSNNAQANQQIIPFVNMDNNIQFRQFQNKRICPKFALGQCDIQDCIQTHQLTTDNSIKRLYFKVFQRNNSMNNSFKILCKMFKFNGNRLFALVRSNILGFYELDDENQMFKAVSSNQLKMDSNITSISVNFDQDNTNFFILLTTQNDKIHKFSPRFGLLQSVSFPQSAQTTQTAYFGQQPIIFAGNKTTELAVLKNQQKDAKVIQKLQQNSPQIFKGIVTVIRQCSVQGQNFLVIGTKLGFLSFINKSYENRSIQIQNSQICDISTTTLASKPFAFVVVSSITKSTSKFKYELISINLLDFSTQSVLNSQDLQLSRVCCIYDKILIGIDQVGVIMYALSDLSKIKGRIPFAGKITQIQGDTDGNMLIFSQNNQQNQSLECISVYKIRK